MTKHVMLCADEESLRHPEILGLEGEALDGVAWMQCASTAEECRNAARRGEIEEAWVLSCEDMPAVNVAAALKSDDASKRVYLACCKNSGSLASRATAAHLDGVLSTASFVERYALAKRSWGEASSAQASKGAVQENSAYVAAPEEAGFAQQNACQIENCTNSRAGARILHPAQRSSALPTGDGTVVAVVGASGGCGKSSVAALLATISAKAGFTTLAVDADLQFGDMHRIMSVAEPVRIDDVVADPSKMTALLDEAKRTESPALLAAPRRPELCEEIARELPEILDAARCDYEVTIVCAGAFWNEANALIIDAADAVVFLIDARPASLAATLQAVGLCARMGLATTSFIYAVNRFTREGSLSGMDASCALKGATTVELSDGGRDVEDVLCAGFPNEFVASGNRFAQDVGDLLVRLLPGDQATKVSDALKPKGGLKRLFGRGSRK